MAIQRKVCNSEIKEFDEKDLSVVHFISSELPDRGGDILYAAKNDKGAGMVMFGRPVVLQQHGWGEMGMEPIAKPIWIRASKFKDRNGIECKTQFFPDDLGKRLFKKTSEGYMPNWSVGWMPMEGKVEIKDEIRHVYEWELLEYSIVGVPMQPDAQTGEIGSFLFKMIPELEEKRGELVAWKKDDGSWEEKPYPNEHACRLEDPDKYIRIRRQNDKFGKGIHAIWGVQSGGKPVELQAIRFSKSKFTAAEARAWLKSHDYKCKLFEPSSEKCEKCGEEKGIVWDIKLEEGQTLESFVCSDGTCTAEFHYYHVCKEVDETCSCDGEADDKEVCSVCKKPKKLPKKEAFDSNSEDIFICAKCNTPYLRLVDKEIDGAKVYLWKKQCECKEDKQTDDDTVEELPADPESDEDVGFVMVDADAVRKDNGTEDFIHGGHHYIFDFIPEPEIWIDERMTDEDIMQIKCDLFVNRECMKYCDMNSQEPGDIGIMIGKAIRHLIDPMTEGGGNHDVEDRHRYEHAGNHFHDSQGMTLRWDTPNQTYIVHSLGFSLNKEQKEAFEKDMDEAIKQVAIKYGLREAPPAEPEVGKEKPAINTPEPRKIVIFTEDDRKKAEQDRKTLLSEMLEPVVIQIGEVLKKIPVIVKEEMDRLKGRVK